MTEGGFPRLRAAGVIAFARRGLSLSLLLLAFAAFFPLYAQTSRPSGWRSATEDELRSFIPARAPVVNERIETELPSASGITDGKGHFVAGVVLITAGYSAEGKYSHYFVSQVPLRIGDFSLNPGQYLIGWVRQEDQLKVTFYDALTGKPLGSAIAVRSTNPIPVVEFRIWPPRPKALIQLGRFTFSYSLSDNDPGERR